MLEVYSPTIPINIGKAQDSFLAPLIFIIYLNDIVRCSIETNFLKYADDSTIYVS